MKPVDYFQCGAEALISILHARLSFDDSSCRMHPYVTEDVGDWKMLARGICMTFL